MSSRRRRQTCRRCRCTPAAASRAGCKCMPPGRQARRRLQPGSTSRVGQAGWTQQLRLAGSTQTEAGPPLPLTYCANYCIFDRLKSIQINRHAACAALQVRQGGGRGAAQRRQGGKLCGAVGGQQVGRQWRLLAAAALANAAHLMGCALPWPVSAHSLAVKTEGPGAALARARPGRCLHHPGGCFQGRVRCR